MKTQNTNFFQSLEKDQLGQLTTEVKETVATEVAVLNNKNVFGAVDYWNLQKMRRNRIVRRHLVA